MLQKAMIETDCLSTRSFTGYRYSNVDMAYVLRTHAASAT